MAEQFWDWLSEGGLLLTGATVLFFTVKGLLWLLVPALIVRKVRSRVKKA